LGLGLGLGLGSRLAGDVGWPEGREAERFLENSVMPDEATSASQLCPLKRRTSTPLTVPGSRHWKVTAQPSGLLRGR